MVDSGNISIINGIYKKKRGGNNYELFSELFTYNLIKLLERPVAEYSKENINSIKTLDYTNNAKVNYEPMESIVGDNEDYEFNMDKLSRQDLITQYLDIIFIDTIIMNSDRHTFNYGVLRDVATGDIISIAPMLSEDIIVEAINNVIIDICMSAYNSILSNRDFTTVKSK